MSSGELSFDFPTSLRVTWKIPGFFRLATGSSYSLQSPDFPFADCRYCLRLFQTRDSDDIDFELLSLMDPDCGRAVLLEVQLKSLTGEKDVGQDRRDNREVFRFPLERLESERDLFVPGGTLTCLCSVRPRTPSSAEHRIRVIRPHRGSVGELSSESTPSLYVTWTIPGYFHLPRDICNCHTLESPEFPFSGRRYRLRLVSECFDVDIRLVNLSNSDPGRCVWYEVGFKSTSGEEIDIYRCGTSTTRYFFFHQDELELKKSECFPDAHLTVFCCVGSREPSSAGSPTFGGAETPRSKEPVPEAAGQTKSVGVRTSDEERLPGLSKLQSDYKQLLLKGLETDACLVVCGKEFRAHQNILRARSTVFDAMFGHEMAERESGRVTIDDLDPDSFGHFLEYLYTEDVGVGLSDDNAFGLYEAADKYDVPTLKAECVAHMRRSLSVDSFCDFLAVALRHPEEELMPQAVTFFKENMARIIVTVKWQQFVIDNGTSANELLIKAVVPPGQ